MSQTGVTTKTYEESIIYVGQTICVPVEKVVNSSGVTATDVVVKLDKIPDGLEYSSANLPRGEFDVHSRTWIVGTMSPNEALTGLLCFTVTDDSKSPFQFNLTVGLGEYCENCKPANSYCVIVKGISCTELAACGLLAVKGVYDDDADAGANGVQFGEFYELSPMNSYGLPDGTIKKRIDLGLDPTPTASVTLSPTPTMSFTPSLSFSPTATPSISLTPTVTPTISITPSVTPTISISPTISVTPTVTATASTTVTPTISATPSITISPTITVTPSISLTTTPSSSITPTVTPSITITTTPSVTPSPSV